MEKQYQHFLNVTSNVANIIFIKKNWKENWILLTVRRSTRNECQLCRAFVQCVSPDKIVRINGRDVKVPRLLSMLSPLSPEAFLVIPLVIHADATTSWVVPRPCLEVCRGWREKAAAGLFNTGQRRWPQEIREGRENTDVHVFTHLSLYGLKRFLLFLMGGRRKNFPSYLSGYWVVKVFVNASFLSDLETFLLVSSVSIHLLPLFKKNKKILAYRELNTIYF